MRLGWPLCRGRADALPRTPTTTREPRISLTRRIATGTRDQWMNTAASFRQRPTSTQQARFSVRRHRRVLPVAGVSESDRRHASKTPRHPRTLPRTALLPAARVIAERVCRRAARHHEADGGEQLAYRLASLVPVVRTAQVSARRSDLGYPLQAAEVGRAPHLDRRRDRRLRGALPRWLQGASGACPGAVHGAAAIRRGAHRPPAQSATACSRCGRKRPGTPQQSRSLFRCIPNCRRSLPPRPSVI